MSAPTILLSAGEPSGDLHGAAVAQALKERWPRARLYGLGGPEMAKAGVELLADVDRLALMGFVEVAGRLPYFVRLLRRLRRELVARSTDLVLPIDYPGFNGRLARSASRSGIPVLYYIAPQVWAWHASRAKQLARWTDRMAVILPFEEPLFREAGAQATFVGHPLLDDTIQRVSRDAFCDELGLDPERPILAVFPGSRTQELDRHLALFVDTCARVVEERPAVQPVIARAPGLRARAYDQAPYPNTPRFRDLLGHCRAALVKSGTSTLEAALAGAPLVIAYRTHPLTFWLARRLVRVDHVGLANLVAGERLAPELLQDEATPAALSSALLPLLGGDTEERRRMTDGLGRVRAALTPADGERTTAQRVADLAAELLREPRVPA